MSRRIDSKVAKVVGTVGALVSTGTTWVGHLGKIQKAMSLVPFPLKLPLVEIEKETEMTIKVTIH